MTGNSSSRGEPPTSASCHESLKIRCVEELFTSLITSPQVITFGKMASIAENPIPQLERRDFKSSQWISIFPLVFFSVRFSKNSDSSDSSPGPRGLAKISGSDNTMHR